MKHISDTVERVIAEALDAAGIPYRHESEGAELDFGVGDVLIEVCRFHTPRKIEQLKPCPNVILVQGKAAAEMLAALIAPLTMQHD